MDREFPKASDDVTADDRDGSGLVPFVYDERSFNRMLARERKRTERSKRRFLLVLLSRLEPVVIEQVKDPSTRIIASLTTSIRDIDILGWYKSGQVLGIIFPEIDDGAGALAADSILDRVNTNLSANLSPEDRNSIDVSVYLFPETRSIPAPTSDLSLYPDIQTLRAGQKVPLLLKRLMDVVGSLGALIVFSPAFLVIALLIKATSEGPVLFKQRRVGQYGKAFTFLKFRSMYVNSDASIHKEYVRNLIHSSDCPDTGNGGARGDQVFKIQNDPRVTSIGRFIRKTSLDELPQFINVLLGDMSLVGPRPPIPYECENYDVWHRRRIFDMKPGITGLWQVAGRSRTTFDDMVRLDIYYMSNWSLWLDLKILIKTPWVVISSKGGY